MEPNKTFDERAALVKSTLSANEGETPVKTVEGQLTAEQIKNNITVDLKAAVREMDSLRAGNKDRRPVEVSFDRYVKEKWGYGSMESFYDCLGVNPSYHSMDSFNTNAEFNENFRWLVPEII